MKRGRAILSIAIVLLTIISWLAISNHCVLGASAPEQKTQQDECPFHHTNKPAPAKKSSDSPCCKILRATSAKPAPKFAKAIVDLAPVDLSFAEFVLISPPKILLLPATVDTGPPGKTSFVELIGSVRAHAPPALVA